MLARSYLVVLLLGFFLAQGSTAVYVSNSGGSTKGVYSCQTYYLASNSIDISRFFSISPMNGWETTDGSTFGVGRYTELTTLSTGTGSFETDNRQIGFGLVSIQDHGTITGSTISNNQDVSMKGNDLLNECIVQSQGDIKITKTKTDSGSINSGGSSYAGSSGSGIIITHEGPLTIGPRGDGERYEYNGFGYADIRVHVEDGSLTLEPLPLEGDELMKWHLFGSGSLAEMFIEAVNNNGPYASIHAASPGFIEAYPSASVTYNRAEVKA